MMTAIMICRQKRHEEKRFWFCQKRVFVVPVREADRLHASDTRSQITGVSG